MFKCKICGKVTRPGEKREKRNTATWIKTKEKKYQKE